MACIQNLGIENKVRKRVKARLGSFTNLMRGCERGFEGISYIFLLIVVGKEDPIGFFWLLYWYLLHVTGIIFGSYRCCSILCL